MFKKEWQILLLAFIFYYIGYTFEMYEGRLEVSQSMGKNVIFVLCHGVVFAIVNYIFIPQLFYRKKIVLFFLALIGLIAVYGAFEEGVLEKWLYPDTRGKNNLTLQAIYYTFGELLLPLFGFMSLKFFSDNIENQRKIEAIQRNSLSNELKFLKSQIQPHILFNSLNSLYEFTLIKSDKAPNLVLQLSNVLRYVLYETSQERVDLHKEIKFLEEYIALQRVQLEGRGKVNLEVIQGEPKNEYKIAPFLLIPFVENSFKHSTRSMATGIEVGLFLEVKPEQLNFRVSNNFDSGSTTSIDLTTSGIGLENVQKRLALLYPDRHELAVIRTENEYSVTLELNLET